MEDILRVTEPSRFLLMLRLTDSVRRTTYAWISESGITTVRNTATFFTEESAALGVVRAIQLAPRTYAPQLTISEIKLQTVNAQNMVTESRSYAGEVREGLPA